MFIGVIALLIGIFINKAFPNAFITTIVLIIPPYVAFLILKRKMTNAKAASIASRGFLCYIGLLLIFITSFYIIVTPNAEYSAAGIPMISNSSNLEDAWLALKVGALMLVIGMFLFVGKDRFLKIYQLIISYRNSISKIGYGVLFAFALYEYWIDQHLVAAVVGIGALISIKLGSIFKIINK